MEQLHINDVREMSRVRVINTLAQYVPDNQYKRIDFLKMETDVLKDLLVCYLNPKATLPSRSKNVIMNLGGAGKYAPSGFSGGAGGGGSINSHISTNGGSGGLNRKIAKKVTKKKK